MYKNNLGHSLIHSWSLNTLCPTYKDGTLKGMIRNVIHYHDRLP